MISDLFPTRLVWEAGHGGIARRNGVTVRLSGPPDLGRGTVVGLDYVPGMLATVRPYADRERDMEDDERAAAHAMLLALTGPG